MMTGVSVTYLSLTPLRVQLISSYVQFFVDKCFVEIAFVIDLAKDERQNYKIIGFLRKTTAAIMNY